MLWRRAEQHPSEKPALIGPEGTYTYSQLLETSGAVASALLAGKSDLGEGRVAFLVPPGFDHVATQWGIWRAGGMAVPLAVMHPPAEWQYVLEDAQVETLVVHPQFVDGAASLTVPRMLSTDDMLTGSPTALPEISSDRRGMIVYTSGTTGKPKGVVTTHGNINAQIEAMVEAWEWTGDDHILHVLPLHHVHGIVNVLCCPLWVGGTCEFLKFDAEQILHRFAHGDLTLFMAVPTIYSRLLAAWDTLNSEQQQAVRRGCERMRLMVSGSAALPVSVLESWKARTGHVLLERYGMTEIGMALTNPLHGSRRPGHVGIPMPGVEVQLVDESGQIVANGESGEIEVRGPGVFSEYWNRPEASQAAFRDGWFQTGDVAILDQGSYRILGRASSDIIKTGGYKVSALEIEEVLRTHPLIHECAVVGLADDEWGERIAACVISKSADLNLEELRAWAKSELAPYKIPTRLKIVDELPRNAMGKVQKPRVCELFEE